MPTTVRSHAKINLGLAIGPLRPDGFHTLLTLYQTLALHDHVTVSARLAPATRITLTSNHPAVPRDARNTAWRMVESTLAHAGATAEVDIHIGKHLPIQGGLGAGSANAAAALLGLERELSLTIPAPDRLALAAHVGSDVPLFLLGGTVLGEGRGELVSPYPDLPATACVVAIPAIGVSTPQAFRAWDTRHLTDSSLPDTLGRLSQAYAATPPSTGGAAADPGTPGTVPLPNQTPENFHRSSEAQLDELLRAGIENDFETVVFPQYPSLREIKQHLMGSSTGSIALYAALSGSGSALFGLYRSVAEAKAAQQRVQAAGTRALLTETLPRDRYWRTMFAESPHRE